MFTNYFLEMKLLSILALVIGLIFGYQHWHHKIYQEGYDKANLEWQVKNSIADKKAANTLAERNSVIAKAQLELDIARANLNKLIQEKKDAESKFNIERTLYASGAKRMSIAIASCQGNSTGKVKNSTIDSGTNSTERSDLLPETATAILDIARHSAEDVQDFNTLVEQYKVLNDACSK